MGERIRVISKHKNIRRKNTWRKNTKRKNTKRKNTMRKNTMRKNTMRKNTRRRTHCGGGMRAAAARAAQDERAKLQASKASLAALGGGGGDEGNELTPAQRQSEAVFDKINRAKELQNAGRNEEAIQLYREARAESEAAAAAAAALDEQQAPNTEVDVTSSPPVPPTDSTQVPVISPEPSGPPKPPPKPLQEVRFAVAKGSQPKGSVTIRDIAPGMDWLDDKYIVEHDELNNMSLLTIKALANKNADELGQLISIEDLLHRVQYAGIKPEELKSLLAPGESRAGYEYSKYGVNLLQSSIDIEQVDGASTLNTLLDDPEFMKAFVISLMRSVTVNSNDINSLILKIRYNLGSWDPSAGRMSLTRSP